jgi:hypothetical protein
MDNKDFFHEDDHLPRQTAFDALGEGPRGAFILSAIAAGLLFIGWLLFYFLIFMRRGYIG